MEKKTVLITGASSGIGEGCARKFAMNGYRLILNGRNVEKLTAVNGISCGCLSAAFRRTRPRGCESGS